MAESTSKFRSYATTIIAVLLSGAIFNYFDNSKCAVCNDYTYEQHIETSFSDKDIADMVGSDRVSEYKNKLKNEPAAIYVLKLSDPEKLDNDQTRGSVYLGTQTKMTGIMAYKGKFLTTPNDSIADGIIRIEYVHNDRTDSWEQVAFNKSQNLLFFKIQGKDIVVNSKTTGDLGLVLTDAKFIRD